MYNIKSKDESVSENPSSPTNNSVSDKSINPVCLSVSYIGVLI